VGNNPAWRGDCRPGRNHPRILEGAKSMKAIRVQQYGGVEQLRYDEVPDPSPDTGQVLVRVRAASVNPIDFKLGSGAMRDRRPINLPWIPGGDFAGIVENLGSGITGMKKGDAVFGNTPGGGAYAALLVTPADFVAPKPPKLSFPEAASVPLAAQTAWQGIFEHGQLQSGQTILIHAAAGGVGSFAVQFAHWKGARVLATASADNADYVRSLGADQVIDYRATRFETVAKNVDVVFDLMGGDTQTKSFGVLKPGGYLIALNQPPSQETATKLKVHAMLMGMKPNSKRLSEIAALLDSGKVKTLVSKIVPLPEAKEAWKQSMSGHTRGKIVLQVPG
jgi:NADPH:quinone reductase-like Zn-dependent oxidoreductase